MSQLKLTILGKSPAFTDLGGAASGYLAQTERSNLLIDCGSGVVGELRRQIEHLAELETVFITHMHADHFFDLVPLAYSLTLVPPPYGRPKQRPVLYLPRGGRKALRGVCTIWESPATIEDAFDIVEYDPTKQLSLGRGGIEIQTMPVPHSVPTVAVDIRSTSDGSRFTYSADCGLNDSLEILAQETPLLICEATLPAPDLAMSKIHLAAVESGEIAERAGARRLCLTHFTDLFDDSYLLSEAARSYSGEVSLAEPALSFEDLER